MAVYAKISTMIKQLLQKLIAEQTGAKPEDIKIVKPPKAEFGDYAVFVKGDAKVISDKLSAISTPEIDHIEAKAGFVNFFLSTDFVQSELARMQDDTWFMLHDTWTNKTIMVEYTDPNPFKLFHIGHLMSNAIGETIARLHEAVGAKVLRVNYQGDVGMHVAKAVYATGDYVAGNKAFETDPTAKAEIEAINKKIYDRSDLEINKLYDQGRKASLEYFEKQYERLGTKFVHYFFESEMAPIGLELIKQYPDIFVESQGATVFHGEHTRVFINSQGLPTYEAKELGLNKTKFETYHPDLSIIVTANEIKAYFEVLMEAMAKIMPDVAAKTRHIPHGMMKLPTGKMSSRTGDVITADDFIEQVKAKTGSEETAIGAIKYSILKQGIGNDIVFDFEKSLAVNGDSGVYLQYTYARLKSILEKSQISSTTSQTNFKELNELTELNIIKHLIEFPDAVAASARDFAPNHLALYLYELANKANAFYEQVRILIDENEERKQARLVLVQTTANILKRGLDILGIKAPEKI
ncbi:MAG: arginine--tRNA ligase [Patescibacteria group bacterium]